MDVLIEATVSERGDGIRLNIKALDTETAAIIAGKSLTIAGSSETSGLMRRDVGSGARRAANRGTAQPPDVRAFRNSFLIVRVESVGVANDLKRAILAITVENKSSTDEYIGCDDPALVDDRAGYWYSRSLTGIEKTEVRYAKNNPERLGYTQFSPGSKTAVTMVFESGISGNSERPSVLSFSVSCARRSGEKAVPFFDRDHGNPRAAVGLIELTTMRCLSAERGTRLAIDHRLEVDARVRQSQQIFRLEDRSKLSRDHSRVLSAGPET